MKTVDQMVADIIRREGGFVDDEDDRGGATKHGVSLVYARGVGIRMDLDHDGDVDKDDIMLVTPPIAAELFKEDFLRVPKFDRVDERLQPFLFDSAVNHGPGTAAQFLQRALITLGFLPKYSSTGRPQDDGVVGPGTLAAVRKAQSCTKWTAILEQLAGERRKFMRAIVYNDPSQGKFLAGWLNRVDEVVLDALGGK